MSTKFKKAIKKIKAKPKQFETTKHKGIYFSPNSKTYTVKYSNGYDSTGKQLRKSQSGFTSLAEAIKYKNQVERLKREEKLFTPTTEIKLLTFATDYLESKKQLGEIKATTVYGYERMLKRLAQHPISNKKLNNIKPSDIREYLIYLKENSTMKANTINKDRQFLLSAFERARKDGIVQTNPVEMVDKLNEKTDEKFTHKFLTVQQCTDILSLLEEYHNINVKSTFYLGVFAGLRRGEMVGLKWENIDFDKNIMAITNNRVKVGGQVIETTPKSANSNRVLPLPPQLAEYLQKVKEYQNKRFGKDFCKYVMTNPETGQPLCPTSLQKPFKGFLTKYNIPDIRVHDLRHTCATLLLTNSTDIKTISVYLGHQSTGITEKIYLHNEEYLREKASNSMAEIFANSKK